MIDHRLEIARFALAWLGGVLLIGTTTATEPEAGSQQEKVVIPFDFESTFDQGRYGRKVGDLLWKKLERRGQYVIPEAMLDVREWSERTKTVPNPDTSLEKMQSIVQDTFGGDIGIWGKIERLPHVEWDQYDLWIHVVDFSHSPPKVISKIKAQTKTVSEIPHLYVKQALDQLYGVQGGGVAGQPDEATERRWETEPNLVTGTFDTLEGWEQPEQHVSRQTERGARSASNHFIRFSIPRGVARTSGVLYYSDYFPIEPGATYRFQCRWRSSGPAAKVFIKCYTERHTSFTQRPDGEVRQSEKREVYRSQQNLKGVADTWNTHTEDFTPKHTQYEPRFGRVMLYGYLRQGTLDWDDVVVKQIVPAPETPTRIRRPSLETKVRSEELEQLEQGIDGER